ncbi:MAG: SDR family oxidoreductase [Chitinophagales bacterium]|nr:SDR family oxidoreductase [Chitinophagales bacterium]
MQMSLNGKVIVISGVARGIGKALVLEVAKHGMLVAGFDVRKQELDELQFVLNENKNDCLLECVNITNEQMCKQFIEAVVAKYGKIDILINNAGITHIAPEKETKPNDVEKLMQVNVLGLMYLSHYALPHIIKQKGTLVSLSSVAGYSPLLYRTAYAASKHAVWGYMNSLRAEMRDKNVKVLTVCPSFVATQLQENQQQYFTNNTNVALNSESVAKEILKAIIDKKELALIGKTAKQAYWLNRFFPKLYEKIMIKKTKIDNK